jgi:Ras-related protein Rab-32
LALQLRVYLKDAVAALVLIDVTRVAAFDNAAKWKAELDERLGPDLPVLLVVAKVDLLETDAAAPLADVDQFCEEHRFAEWCVVSSQQNLGVERAFAKIVSLILQQHILICEDERRVNASQWDDGQHEVLSDPKCDELERRQPLVKSATKN